MRFIALLLLTSLCWGQEIKRPTTDIDPGSTAAYGCSGSSYVGTGGSVPYGYDAAGQSTSSDLRQVGGNATKVFFVYKNRQLKTWQSSTQTYTSLSLNINSASGGAQQYDGGGGACIAYSLNAGSTWTSVRCDTSSFGWNQTTDSIVLSPSQSLAALRVGICAKGNTGVFTQQILPGGDDVQLFDVWTLGSTTPQQTGAGTTGSTAGQAHRGIVIVN